MKRDENRSKAKRLWLYVKPFQSGMGKEKEIRCTNIIIPLKEAKKACFILLSRFIEVSYLG